MKQNIIALIFGIIALSFAFSEIGTLIYLQMFSGRLVLSDSYNPATMEQAIHMAKVIMSVVFALFGIGCGLVAVLVGRNGTEGSRMRKIGTILGITGMVGTAVLLIVSFF